MNETAWDRFVNLGGLRLHFRQWGSRDNRPLLLLHASGCHAHWWDVVGPLFADRYYVIAPDLRGHGDSGRPEPPDYSFHAYMRDIEGLVQVLDLQDFYMVGHSMGGFVALLYAGSQPKDLRALVAADMLCEVEGEMLERMRKASERPQPTFATKEEAEQRFRLQPPETVAGPGILRMLASEAVCPTEDERWTFKFDRRALKQSAVRLWDILPQVARPVLVMHGELSPLMSAVNAELVAGKLSQGEWRTLPGTYHNLMLDDPIGFATTVQDFFKEQTD